jgi:hypothetical protein
VQRRRYLDVRFGFDGTLAPLRRASERPIAIACFLSLTVLPDRPDLSLPRFISCIDRLTLREAVLPYFRFEADFLRGIDSLRWTRE